MSGLFGSSSALLEMPWLIAFIFVAETCVVTICTLRTIFLSRGMRLLPPVLGFFEVSIWLFAVGEVMKNLSDVRCSLAFAGGFTAGTFLGVLIEQKLALGSVLVRTITHKDAAPLVRALRAAHYGVTCVAAQGATGPVEMVFTIVPRREQASVIALVKEFDAAAFYSIDGLQSTSAGVAPRPASRRVPSPVPLALLQPLRGLL